MIQRHTVTAGRSSHGARKWLLRLEIRNGLAVRAKGARSRNSRATILWYDTELYAWWDCVTRFQAAAAPHEA
eukprot:COSAG02_NODE_64866_length_259_cov_0.925000_1_plen_71_part_10